MKKGIIFYVLLMIVTNLVAQTKPAPKKSGSAVSHRSGTTATSAADLKASLERGKKVYTTTCLACHQADGGGVPNMNPPLIKTKWVLGDKKKLITVVLKGLNDPIEIDDEEFHNAMPPQAHLSDQEIADVLTFVRNNFGNKASAVSPGEVKSVRAKLK